MKPRPRLYTDWRRPSKDRNRRLWLLVTMVVLTGLALWLFGGEIRQQWPEYW